MDKTIHQDSEIAIYIRKIEEAPGGKRRTVYITVSNGEQMSDEQYTVLAYFYPDALAEQALLDTDAYDLLVTADEATRAAMRGADLLNLSDHTKKQLSDKLMRKGFSRDASQAAVAYLEEKGAIREEAFLVRTMEYLCDTKRFGPNKINMELTKRGFSRSQYRDTYEDTMARLDFHAACLERVKKIGVSAFDEYQSRQKHFAALMRQGFSGAQIRAALAAANEEDELY